MSFSTVPKLAVPSKFYASILSKFCSLGKIMIFFSSSSSDIVKLFFYTLELS